MAACAVVMDRSIDRLIGCSVQRAAHHLEGVVEAPGRPAHLGRACREEWGADGGGKGRSIDRPGQASIDRRSPRSTRCKRSKPDRASGFPKAGDSHIRTDVYMSSAIEPPAAYNVPGQNHSALSRMLPTGF